MTIGFTESYYLWQKQFANILECDPSDAKKYQANEHGLNILLGLLIDRLPEDFPRNGKCDLAAIECRHWQGIQESKVEIDRHEKHC
mmetsp:Transcript_11267/g.26600  ORF Transcript_11267/g.26600 Transcript_11267/m.26600 type:complete len:86 (+) Transcript_11267:93-350(+)